MNTHESADFEVSTSNEVGFESVFLWGPLWSYPLMATRGEAIIIAQQIRICCFQPTQFAMLLASGDRFAVSRWGNRVVLEFGGVRTFMSPMEGLELAELVLEAWSAAPTKAVA
jgi:hypothetical protein